MDARCIHKSMYKKFILMKVVIKSRMRDAMLQTIHSYCNELPLFFFFFFVIVTTKKKNIYLQRRG